MFEHDLEHAATETKRQRRLANPAPTASTLLSTTTGTIPLTAARSETTTTDRVIAAVPSPIGHGLVKLRDSVNEAQ